MGFEDRAYSQEDWNAEPRVDTNVTKWFVILVVALFVIQAVSGSDDLFELLILKADAVLRGQVWRLLTFAVTQHPVQIINLVFSLLIVWHFGTQLERMYGSRELGAFIVGMILAVGVAFSSLGLFASVGVPLYGSFTVALGLLTLYATHFPRVEVYVLPLITIQLRWLVGLYALFGIYPALMLIQRGDSISGLALVCNVLSIPFAVAYRRWDWHLSAISRAFNLQAWRRAWRTRAAAQRLRVYAPAPESNVDEKLDALLAKIHEHGSDSLTEAERDFLKRASERYKNRI